MPESSSATDVDITSPQARGRLLGLAYRMLGSWTDAEDVVQQSYERWYRLADTARAEINNPPAWFTTVTSRLCLNLLESAPRRREHYVGPWLPEPLPPHTVPETDPLENIGMAESVSMALMVALEALTPTQRVSYILHEAFGMGYAEIADITGSSADAARQAAAAARRRLRTNTHGAEVSRAEHSRVVAAFEQACLSGNIEELVAMLDPQVISTSDGNGTPGIARRPVAGAATVAQFLYGILAQAVPGTAIVRTRVNGETGFVFTREHGGVSEVYGVLTCAVAAGRITRLWFSMNPAKLVAWNTAAPDTATGSSAYA